MGPGPGSRDRPAPATPDARSWRGRKAVSDASRRYWNEAVLAPTDVKLQHYVPQFYLRRFADAKDLVRVVDLSDGGRAFRTNIRNAAAETRFYDIPVGDETVSTE